MSLGILTASLVERGKREEVAAVSEYRSADLASAYWLMIDLRGSATFRMASGDERSFVRYRVFAGMIHHLVAAYSPDVEVFKELGDGLLLRSTGARALFEILTVANEVARHWEVDALIDEEYPSLGFRAAVTAGEAFAFEGDYFGRPIDRVARLSGYKDTDDELLTLVDAEVRSAVVDRFRQEMPFLSFSTPVPVSAQLLKARERPFLVSKVVIDRVAFREFDRYFLPLRRTLNIH